MLHPIFPIGAIHKQFALLTFSGDDVKRSILAAVCIQARIIDIVLREMAFNLVHFLYKFLVLLTEDLNLLYQTFHLTLIIFGSFISFQL